MNSIYSFTTRLIMMSDGIELFANDAQTPLSPANKAESDSDDKIDRSSLQEQLEVTANRPSTASG